MELGLGADAVGLTPRCLANMYIKFFSVVATIHGCAHTHHNNRLRDQYHELELVSRERLGILCSSLDVKNAWESADGQHSPMLPDLYVQGSLWFDRHNQFVCSTCTA